MQAPDSEPEKYSLDEMMTRLKRKGSSDEEGELVTREDGSQAVKIRKRRRRTNQAVNKETKRNARLQLIQITALVVFIVLVGLAVGIGIVYGNSKVYREKLVEKLETSSGAKVDLTQFRMNPSTANANSVTLSWPEGNALSKLEVAGIVARLHPSSFLGKAFAGEEIVSNQGTLTLQVPKEDSEAVFQSSADAGLAVRFDRYFVPRLNVFFDELKAADRMFEQTEASFYPGALPGQAELRLTGGTLKMKDWPSLRLDRSYIQMRGGELNVVSMRYFGVGDEKGYLDLSGKIKPLAASASHVLAASVEDLRISQLIGADLGRFVSGRVDTRSVPESNFLSFQPGESDSAVLQLDVRNSLTSRIDLGGFRFLSSLSLTMEDRWFEVPVFDDDASVRIVRRGADIELREIEFTYRGRMALRGDLFIDKAGNLKGNLRLGIADTMVASSPTRRLDAMFGQVREGFRWVDLVISGTSAVPEDNFAALFEAARDAATNDAAPGGDSAPDSFEDLIDSR